MKKELIFYPDQTTHIEDAMILACKLAFEMRLPVNFEFNEKTYRIDPHMICSVILSEQGLPQRDYLGA